MGLFGGEKIILTLEKIDYKPGDVIKGTITLNLNKPTKAKKLEVIFVGERFETRPVTYDHHYHGDHHHRHNRYSTGTQHVSVGHVYDFTMLLDGEKEYQSEQYQFEIKIPADVLQLKTNYQQKQENFKEKAEEKLGTFGKILTQNMAIYPSHIKWIIHAHLDVPMKLDIKNSQDITIS